VTDELARMMIEPRLRAWLAVEAPDWVYDEVARMAASVPQADLAELLSQVRYVADDMANEVWPWTSDTAMGFVDRLRELVGPWPHERLP
jgi:hypothetical protein